MQQVAPATKPAPVAVAADPNGIPPQLIVQKLFETSPGELTLHHINAFVETTKVYENGRAIHGGQVLGNADTVDERKFPAGYSLSFSPKAHVDPITLTNDAYMGMVLCEIIPGAKKNQTLTDEYFKTRLANISEAAPQFSDMPISAKTRHRTNIDDDHWKAEMGSNGAYGVVKKRNGPRSFRYYIYARCGAEVFGNNVIKEVTDAKKNGTPLTWEDFLRSKPVLYWKNAVVRNACRLAHSVASKLDVVIQTIDEDATYLEDANQAPKATALPDHQQFISSLAFSQSKGQTYATQYSHSAPVTKGEFHFVSVSPFEGLIGLNMDGSLFTGNALPTTTGRVDHPVEVIKKPIAVEDLEHITSQYTWEGKPDQDDLLANPNLVNDRVHPEAYRKCDDDFINKNFVAQGWKKENGSEAFDAVIMKVSTRKGRQ